MLKRNDDGSYSGNPDEVHAAVKQMINSRIGIMEKCLKMGHECIVAMLDAPSIDLGAVVAKDPAPVFAVIASYIGREPTDEEKQDVAYGLTHTFAKGFSPCDVWLVAHELEHLFFPDEAESPPRALQN